MTARQLCEPLEVDDHVFEMKLAAWSWAFLQPVSLEGMDTGRQKWMRFCHEQEHRREMRT